MNGAWFIQIYTNDCYTIKIEFIETRLNTCILPLKLLFKVDIILKIML